MLGISFGEIMIIGTIGLIIIGPKRLPETARFLGHLFGKMQRQVNSVKADIRREMALEDMKKIHRDYEDTARDVRNAFDQAAAGVPPPETLINNVQDNSAADTSPAASDDSVASDSPAASDSTNSAAGDNTAAAASPDESK